eukprot:gnl/TRDRNA2_/TRDRNA2_165630_c0_seq3.p1 gnl/TRDRNA2_/TRDRNA2_165630_c0~~gnl/TRDRNA2_/TRDRNA2_165630_c0_seq3.p1  ORF type:complete len:243 (-),score=55.61 gnl/TRDRNA2_/TRDRNA2_165630_c0_seq3:139-867(-)
MAAAFCSPEPGTIPSFEWALHNTKLVPWNTPKSDAVLAASVESKGTGAEKLDHEALHDTKLVPWHTPTSGVVFAGGVEGETRDEESFAYFDASMAAELESEVVPRSWMGTISLDLGEFKPAKNGSSSTSKQEAAAAEALSMQPPPPSPPPAHRLDARVPAPPIWLPQRRGKAAAWLEEAAEALERCGPAPPRPEASEVRGASEGLDSEPDAGREEGAGRRQKNGRGKSKAEIVGGIVIGCWR